MEYRPVTVGRRNFLGRALGAAASAPFAAKSAGSELGNMPFTSLIEDNERVWQRPIDLHSPGTSMIDVWRHQRDRLEWKRKAATQQDPEVDGLKSLSPVAKKRMKHRRIEREESFLNNLYNKAFGVPS